MRSQWDELKETAITLRKSGQSLKTIHHNLGIPQSTLSGWLRDVKISDEQRIRLDQNKADAWRRAHQKAADWHRTQKALRDLKAKQEAQEILKNLDTNKGMLDLALAMLLFGNGPRREVTQISSSSPRTLRLILSILQKNYTIDPKDTHFSLSLRADQDSDVIREYWAKELTVPREQFGAISIDKRTTDKPTNDDYKGVCIIRFNSVAIHRKLRYLYDLFCERITDVT